MSKLYIVGTPIGNLGDLSPRAREALEAVDFIAAEDTRVTNKLLMHFGIKKPMVSCHVHNIRQRSAEIVARIAAGEVCAVVTDAGMPCISDPGEELVRLAAESGVEVVSVPGPSAFTAALAASGLSTSRFSFEGFLSVTKKQRRAHLEEIKTYPHTMIFYEAPHKLVNTLADLREALGDRRAALCRELTKLHEEVLRGRLSELMALYAEKAPRGEYVLVLEGAPRVKAQEFTIEEAAGRARELLAGGMGASEASKTAASECGCKKSEIYKLIIKE